jgi:hypothetical protein
MPRVFIFGVFQWSTSFGMNLSCDCSSFLMLNSLAGMIPLFARRRSSGRKELPSDGRYLSSTISLPCDAESPIEPRGVPPAAFNASSSTAVDVVYVGAHGSGRKIGMSCRVGAPAAGAGRPWCDVIVR